MPGSDSSVLERVAWPLRPVPAFLGVQLLPLLAWLVLPAADFGRALQGTERAPLSIGGLAAYGLLCLSFAVGARGGGALASRRPPAYVREDDIWLLRLAHYGALILAVFSTAMVIRLVLASGVSVFAVILASQANVFKAAVYGEGGGALIMGRHLVLASLITWLAIGRWSARRPRTLPILLLAAGTLFLFTSSRLTLLSVVIIAMLFRFGRRDSRGDRQPVRLPLVQAVTVAALLLIIFAGGVWLRSIATWRGAGDPWGVLLGPLYEAAAYFISPVNYSLAFVAQGIAFARGLSLDHFFSFVYTVLNVNTDDSFRELIAWNYNASLNQIGLVGEWYTIAGPLLWVPGLVYGAISGAAFELFRRRALSGTLLYPIVLCSICDSERGFLLPQNVMAANLLFLAVAAALIALNRATTSSPRVSVES